MSTVPLLRPMHSGHGHSQGQEIPRKAQYLTHSIAWAKLCI